MLLVMSNFETGKPPVNEGEDSAEKVSARLEKIKSTQIGDLSPEELMLLVGERQALKEREEEAVMDKSYEEALGENAEYDAQKTAEKEAQEKQKAADMAQEQADKDKVAEIVEQLKGGEAQNESIDSKSQEALKLFLTQHGYKPGQYDKSLGWGPDVIDGQEILKELSFFTKLQSSDIEFLTSQQQEELAQGFFDRVIGNEGMPKTHPQEAYSVYQKLKGTPFAEKFKTLEDRRLKKFGFGPFDL